MANLSTDPNLLYLVTTGWRYVQDVYWLLTAEGAKDLTHEQIERLKYETARVVKSPSVDKAPPSLPSDVEPTLEKINNIMHFMIPTCEYLGHFCFYAGAGSYLWHVSTRFFTTVSLTFFAASAFFTVLWSDFKEAKETAICLQRKFTLIMGDEGSLKKLHIGVRVDLTKVHIGDALHNVNQLSKSLYLLKYILGSAIKQTESHLRGLEQRIIST